MNEKRRSIVAALALAVGLGACDDIAGNDMARVSVLLTDAPADFVSAEVEILEIYLQGTTDDDSGDRITLFTGSEVYDLLDLRNGVTAELAEATIPPGTYHELRLVVGDATITTEGGRTYSTETNTLHCPSCAQSGLKVKLAGEGLRLEEGANSLIIDFDVAQSFGHAAGRSGRWIMHPVIRATSAEAAASITGTVALATGVTLPACGGGPVTLSAFVPRAVAGDVTITGVTEDDGDLRFTYVGPATYTMGFVDAVQFDNGDVLTIVATPSVANAVVSSGSNVDVDYTITGATCTAAPAS